MDNRETVRFEELYNETYVPVVAYCRRRARSFHDAEEAVATTFLVAWRRFDEFEGAESPLAWLYSVAFRTLANQHRARRRQAALRTRLIGAKPLIAIFTEQEAEGRLAVTRAFDALQQLSAHDQEIVRLVAFERLTYRQVALSVGKTESAIRSDLFRARKRLRVAFHASGPSESSGGDHP